MGSAEGREARKYLGAAAVAFGNRLTNVSCHSVALRCCKPPGAALVRWGQWAGGRQLIHCPPPHPPIPMR